MPMPVVTPPSLRALWDAPTPPLGTFVFLRDPASTEIALAAGHDFTVLDMEHSLVDLQDAAGHQRAAEAARAPMLVRLPGFDPAVLGRLLDLGVAGALLPHFGADRQAAIAFASALRYPPSGTRGACTGVRAAGYGLGSFAEYTQRADRSLVAVGLVEDIQGVEHLEELLRVAPVDAVMPGPGDLSTSMGLPGQPQHPRVREAVAHVAEVARRAGVRIGFYLNDPAEVPLWAAFKPAFHIHLFDTKVLAFAQRTSVQAVRGALEGMGATEEQINPTAPAPPPTPAAHRPAPPHPAPR